MSTDTIIIIQGVVSLAAITALGIYAQSRRILAEDLADGIMSAYGWIDEIIEALENQDDTQGDAAIDRLIFKRRDSDG